MNYSMPSGRPSKKVKNINELKQVLAKQGIVTHLKYKSGTTDVQGISFSKGEYRFKGSEIDRSLSYAKLIQAIEQQQVKPEKSLADQLREVMENAKQERESQNNAEQNTYLKQEPETHYLRQSLSAGADLLGGLLGDIVDDDDSPERRRRKKNEQQQKQRNIEMKEIDELNDRMNGNDEIVDSIIKKMDELEKREVKNTDYSLHFEALKKIFEVFLNRYNKKVQN
jgi:hypothetical protein